MRLLEIDTGGNPSSADGIAAVLWSLSERLVFDKHQVLLLVRTSLDDDGQSKAREGGVQVAEALHSREGITLSPLWKAFRKFKPDVVHLHGAFFPQLAAAAMLCKVLGIPYAYSPHGGLTPHVQHQRPKLRRAYLSGVERRVARGAQGTVACTLAERTEIAEVIGSKGRSAEVIAPPVNASLLDQQSWQRSSVGKPLIYLGRYEVFQKGLDLMADLATVLPEVTFELHGEVAPRDREAFDALVGSSPPNMHWQEPVFGDSKWDALRSAAMYIQTSRFEGFPVSIAEAMSLGVPCAISERIGLAEEFRTQDLGLVLAGDATMAGAQLRTALENEQQLQIWSARSREYATTHFAPAMVAEQYQRLYRRIAGTG